MQPQNAALIPIAERVYIIRNRRIVPCSVTAPATLVLNDAFVHVQVPGGAICTVSADRVYLHESDAVTAANLLELSLP